MKKLMCINASDRGSLEYFPNWVEEGETYTVRRIEDGMYGRKRVLLEEIKNPPMYVEELMGKTEPGFNMERFVPVEDSSMEETESVSEELEEAI